MSKVLSASNPKERAEGYVIYSLCRVKEIEEKKDRVYESKVLDSSCVYEVVLDIEHPRKSKCSCSIARNSTIVCRHKVATFFTLFPLEARWYYDLELDPEGDELVTKSFLRNTFEEAIHDASRADLMNYLLHVLDVAPYDITKEFMQNIVDVHIQKKLALRDEQNANCLGWGEGLVTEHYIDHHKRKV